MLFGRARRPFGSPVCASVDCGHVEERSRAGQALPARLCTIRQCCRIPRPIEGASMTSSLAAGVVAALRLAGRELPLLLSVLLAAGGLWIFLAVAGEVLEGDSRSAEHTSELQSLMRTSYSVFCLTQKN